LEDEGSDDENSISLSAIKNKYKKSTQGASGSRAGPSGYSGHRGKLQAPIYSSDEDNEEEEEEVEEGSDVELGPKTRSTERKKRLHVSDDEDEGQVSRPGEYVEEEFPEGATNQDEDDGAPEVAMDDQ